MKKTRKPSIGSTNRKTEFNEKTKKWFRAPSHKLIAPGVYEPTANYENVRSINDKAVWKEGVQMDEILYDSIHNTSYLPPQSLQLGLLLGGCRWRRVWSNNPGGSTTQLHFRRIRPWSLGWPQLFNQRAPAQRSLIPCGRGQLRTGSPLECR